MKTELTAGQPQPPTTGAQRWAAYRKGKLQIAAYLPPQTHTHFKEKSAARGRTMQSQLSMLIKKFVEGEIDV